jgi:hypothetical protein
VMMIVKEPAIDLRGAQSALNRFQLHGKRIRHRVANSLAVEVGARCGDCGESLCDFADRVISQVCWEV